MAWPRVWQAGQVVLQQPLSLPPTPSLLPSPAGLLSSLRNDGLPPPPQDLLKTPSFSRCQIPVVYNTFCPLNKTTGPNGQGFVFGKGFWFEIVNQRLVDGARVILEVLTVRAVGCGVG